MRGKTQLFPYRCILSNILTTITRKVFIRYSILTCEKRFYKYFVFEPTRKSVSYGLKIKAGYLFRG